MELGITVKTVDHGIATGEATQVVKVLSHKMDSIYQEKLVLNVLNTVAALDAAVTYRTHLTANGISWQTEAPLVVV